jgi:hypothetical protein
VVQNHGMGLRAWWRAVRTEPDVVWISGTFQVTSSSVPAFAARMCSGTWTGVLSGEGFAPQAVTHADIAPSDKWPQVGQILPVTFVPTAPELIKFSWSSVPTTQSVGMNEAQSLIDSETSPSSPPPIDTPD